MNTRKNRSILAIMLAYSAAALAAVPLCGPLSASLRGFAAILTAPAQLTIDYFLLGTTGGTFLNVGLVGFACTAVFAASGAALSGPHSGTATSAAALYASMMARMERFLAEIMAGPPGA